MADDSVSSLKTEKEEEERERSEIAADTARNEADDSSSSDCKAQICNI